MRLAAALALALSSCADGPAVSDARLDGAPERQDDGGSDATPRDASDAEAGSDLDAHLHHDAGAHPDASSDSGPDALADSSGAIDAAQLDCPLVYRQGHADLFVSSEQEPGLLTLTLAFRADLDEDPGTGELLHRVEDVCVIVARSQYDAVLRAGGRPASEAYAPIGVAAGESFWFLPQNATLDLPFLGISVEGVPEGILADDRVTLEIRLERSELPPGTTFSTWTSDGTGVPAFLHSTAIGQLSSEHVVSSHEHMNWGFTRAGVHRLSFVAHARSAQSGEPISSAAVEMSFFVEP